MRRRGIAALAAILVATTAATPQEGRKVTTRKPIAPAAQEGPVVLLPVPGSPLVTLRFQFRTGSIDDPDELDGLTAATALAVADGGTTGLTRRQVVERLYPMAASIGVLTDHEVTTFIGQVPRDQAMEFYRLFSTLLRAPRFDAADFVRGRDQLIASIESDLRGHDDEELGKEALNAAIFFGHPYGHPVAGSVQGLRATTIEAVRLQWERQFQRVGLVVGLAGGYSEALRAAVVEDFGGRPPAPPPRSLPAPPVIHGLEVLLVEKPIPTAAISIGAPLKVTRADRDYYALMVANSFLGEHRTFNGRLMNVMRAARGLNYGDYSYIESFVQDGGSTFPLANIPRRQQTFSIWIRPVARENTVFALRQALRELRRLVDTGLTRAEFESTRGFLLNYSRLFTQSQSRRLGYLMDSRFYGMTPFVDRIQEELPSLTVEQVNAAVRRNLDPENLKVVIVADGARGLVQELTSGAPTPIVYQTPTDDPALLAEDKEIERFPLGINAEALRIYPASTMFEE
ncbi:MAG TPA: pitrilysin family protein [Dongiaceae bacterium]|nr:pitrilysin family protein [Dongiaceae bacterium]